MPNDSEIELLKTQISAMRTEIEALKLTISNLETKINLMSINTPLLSIMNTRNFIMNGDNIGGFHIKLESQIINLQTKSGVKKVEYKKYYAKLKVSGKLHRVYLGGGNITIAKAKEKISIYCTKYGIK